MNDKQIIKIDIVEFDDPRLWITDLHNFSYSLFLSPEWIVAMSNENDIPVFLNFMNQGIVVGKLSGLICDEGKIKGRQIYCYASPALKQYTQNIYDACFNALLQFAKSKNLSRIIVGSYDQQHHLKVKASNYFSTARFEYIVDLADESGIKFGKGFKKNVQKAERAEAVYSDDNSPVILNDLFQLLQSTRMRRRNKYKSDYNPFYLKNKNEQGLIQVFDSGVGVLHSVKDNLGKGHCIVYNIEKDKKAYGLLMGSSRTAYGNGFPSFLDYNMLLSLKENGFAYYNIGGGTNDSNSFNLQKYKKLMGGQKHDVYGATTNFLVFPQKLLNPIMTIGRLLPSNNVVVRFLKNIVHFLISLFSLI